MLGSCYGGEVNEVLGTLSSSVTTVRTFGAFRLWLSRVRNREPRMNAVRKQVITTVAALVMVSGDLSAQERSGVDAAVVQSRVMALPAVLVPSASPDVRPGELVAIQDGAPMVPVLSGIFGGIAGLLVADWWADRNCADSCGQPNIAALFLGGAVGAMIGWLIGGGDIPDEAPPGRWP
jgi:hypothetical protein